MHFNLVVSKYSELATYGSLSHRLTAGSNLGDIKEVIDDVVVTESPETDNKSKDELKELKKALQKSNERNKVIEQEYLKCEEELVKKTEEAEMLKSELKDLKQVLKLEKEFEQAQSEHCIDDNDCPKNEDKSKKPRNNNPSSKNAKENIEEEYNCMECDFQASQKTELNKHIQIKHTLHEGIKCRNCGVNFKRKPDLMVHRKVDHPHTVAPCRKGKDCEFSADVCWWKHTTENENSSMIECYFCEMTFETKTKVMMHRKLEHSKTVKACTKFINLACNYTEDTCWFKHREKENAFKSNLKESNQSVFREGPNNPKPPLKTKSV